MTSPSSERDAVESLIEYVNDIKPYHCKIVEVLVEYIYTDELNVSFSENTDIVVDINVNGINLGCVDGFDTGGYDFLAGNLPPQNSIISGNDAGDANILVVSGNVTNLYVPSKSVVITNSTDIDGNYTVSSSTYSSIDDTTEIILTSLNSSSSTFDGNISAYVDDILDLSFSNYDLTTSETCDLSSLGQPTGGIAATSFDETLVIELIPVDFLGAEYDVLVFDGFEDGGFDI